MLGGSLYVLLVTPLRLALVDYRFRESLAGLITTLATSPAVVVTVGTDRTCGRELALDIGNADL